MKKQPVRIIMKPLPSSSVEFTKELKAIQSLDPNAEPTPRAKLYHCMLSSVAIGRCYGHTSVLLVGATGAGKSSTLNHLFDTGEGNIVAITNSSQSETSSTFERVLTVDDPDYEVCDLKLGVVDTPGLSDTRGIKQAACNVHSIQRFFDTHPLHAERYPNLIFLVEKATETRTEGINSNLVKSLRVLKSLGLVDQDHPNVVGVLTWCCSIRHKSISKWKKKMEEKTSIISSNIKEVLHVEAPVVLLENDYDDEDDGLDRDGDYTLLPNGEKQPKNLYDACQRLLEKNGDYFGLMVFNACFAKPKKKKPEDGHKCEAKDASKTSLSQEENNLLKVINATATGGKEARVMDCAVEYINEKKITDPKQKEELLGIVQIMLNIGLENEENWKSSSLEVINYFYQGDISSRGIDMLKSRFNIGSTNISLSSGDVVGYGYDIIHDRPVDVQIIESKSVVDKQFGFQRPACASVVKYNGTRVFQEKFSDEKSYVKSRLRNLAVNIDVAPGVCKIPLRAGFNASYNSEKSDDRSESKYSYLIEHRMFKMKIANFREGIAFTQDFQSAVEKLPNHYNADQNKTNFKKFFERFGYFVVTSAYGGGSVEIQCDTRSRQGSEKTKLSMTGSVTAKLFYADGELSGKSNSLSEDICEALQNSTVIDWHGGSRDLQKYSTLTSNDKLRKWKASLLTESTILTTEMNLEPMSTVVSAINENKGNSCHEALENILGEFQPKANQTKINQPIVNYERAQRKSEPNSRAETIKPPDLGNTWDYLKNVLTFPPLLPTLAVIIGGIVTILFRR